MHGNGRICEYSHHMCRSAHITDAKDVQIAYANAGMPRARGFGRQTPETGLGFVTGVKVKRKKIYVYIGTLVHILPLPVTYIYCLVSSICRRSILLSIQPDTNYDSYV